MLEGTSTTNLSFPKGTTFPLLPNSAEVFYRTDEQIVYIYSGTAWVSVGSGSTGSIVLNDVLPSQDGNAGKILKSDGTNATWQSLPEQVYDIGFTSPGELVASSTLLYFVASRAFTMPMTFANCAVSVGTIMSDVTFSLRKNGVEFGTLFISSAGTTLLSATTDTSFVKNDVLSIESPAGAMPTDLAVTLSVVLV